MGNVESSVGEGPLGPVGNLTHRLQALEETIRSIEEAHQDAHGHHFPAPDAADVCVYGARLLCRPGVRVLVGPVIGEVTSNSVVILLEVDIAPGLGPIATVSCHVSLADDACPRGRVVATAVLRLPSRHPEAFRIGGSGGHSSDTLWPGRSYTVCFGGLCLEDARTRVGRFRTPSACFKPRLEVVALSGDRPDRLAPGEPSLWRVLRERTTAPRLGQGLSPGGGYVDAVLHLGGQAWMGDAFNDAWELFRRRAHEPVLCEDGGWQVAQEEATERLRDAVRRAWNLPDKRDVLSSVSNIMLCGEVDIHPDFGAALARISSSARTNVISAGGGDLKANGAGSGTASRSKKEDTRALDATVRACRRVWCEYQGQLLWKAVAVPGGGDDERNSSGLAAVFDAEERGVEDLLAETVRAEREVAIKERKVAIAEEAFRRAEAAGSLPAELGRKAVLDRIEAIRKELKVARSEKTALAQRPVSAAVSATADRAARGAFLNLGGCIGLALLDTVWARVSWDGRIASRHGERSTGYTNAKPSPTPPEVVPLISTAAWERLEMELSRDSELRLLVVLVQFAVVGGVGGAHGAHDANDPWVSSPGRGIEGEGTSAESETREFAYPDDRTRLLSCLFAWKTGEAWREVVLVCGAPAVRQGRGRLCSACEMEITDSRNPGCVIRQLVAGPITDTPSGGAQDKDTFRDREPVLSAGSPASCGRFTYRQASPTTTTVGASDGDEDSNDGIDDRGSAIPSAAGRAASSAIPATNASTNATTAMPLTKTLSDTSETIGDEGITQQQQQQQQALGWEIKGNGGGAQAGAATGRPAAAAEARLYRRDPLVPISVNGGRFFLEATLDAGLSPAAALAAGWDPQACARGFAATVVAKAVTVPFVGAGVVLGPVIGRVTQGSAVVLMEVGSTAPVACVLTDGESGVQHRQVRMLHRGRPHAFFFEALEESRHYTVSLDGVENARSRTGAFTTLKAWSDRRAPPSLRAFACLSTAAAAATAAATLVSATLPPDRIRDPQKDNPSEGSSHVVGNGNGFIHDRGEGQGEDYVDDDDDNDDDNGSGGGGEDEDSSCDVRLLFVSGTGITICTSGAFDSRGKLSPLYPAAAGDDNGSQGRAAVAAAVAGDLWSAIGREMWGPWPQADVVVHTGSQVDLEVAILEALPILSAAEMEEEGSPAREEAEENAMERIRDAYRFQWSLPGSRECLSCGSHLMLQGEADLAVPELFVPLHGGKQHCKAIRGGGQGKRAGSGAGGRRGKLAGVHVSAYARLALSRLVSRAFRDYQRQLWDPQSVPYGLDMNDVGYARGGAGIDSPRTGRYCGGGGEWHFHEFGETLGLFALDVREGSAGLQRDDRAALLSDRQWASLAAALSLEEVCAMVIVGDAPFITDSIQDSRAKARHPSNAHLRRSWVFHGKELLHLLDMLVSWKSAGALGGEPREVVLVGGGLRYPLETVIRDAVSSVAFTQIVCGPFSGAPRPEDFQFEPAGRLNGRFSYRHYERGVTSTKDECINRGTREPSPVPPIAARAGSNDHYRRYPSCVLVRCEARGGAERARLDLRGRFFAPAEWTAWCDGVQPPGPTPSATPTLTTVAGLKPPSPPPAIATTPPQSSTSPLSLPDTKQAEEIVSATSTRATEFGQPREAPRWALTEGGRGRGTRMNQGGEVKNVSGRQGERGEAVVGMDGSPSLAVLLGEEAMASVLYQAFERVLDLGGGESAAAEAAGSRFFREATRRVFTCIAWAYDHAACGKVRALRPVRPSPVAVWRVLLRLSQQQRKIDTNGAQVVQATAEHTKLDQRRGLGDGSKGDRQEVGKVVKRGPGGRGGQEEEGPSTIVFASLPFHDDESFAAFFCEVLRDSERLARSKS